jgi:1,4-dihydroxy-2-naphthoate octaprenyltransferase
MQAPAVCGRTPESTPRLEFPPGNLDISPGPSTSHGPADGRSHMTHPEDTTVAGRLDPGLRTEAADGLRELPAEAPSGVAVGTAAARPEALADAGFEWEIRWRLNAWFDVPRQSALRQAVPAIVVGTALAMHKGVGFAWYGAVLALAGIAVATAAGRSLLEWVAAGLSGAARPEFTRRDLGIALGAAGCLAAIAWAGGWTVLSLYVAALFFAAGLIPRGISVAWESYVTTTSRIGLTAVAVGVAYLAQSAPWSLDVFVAGAQLGVLATVIGALHTLRDRGHDLKAGRHTIAARFGVQVGQYQVALLCLLPYVMNICWLMSGGWAAALLTLLSLPLALWVIRDVNQTAPGPMLNVIRPRAALLHGAFALLLAIGLVL